MKMTLQSTSEIITLEGGGQARVWEGQTESGIPVVAFIVRVAVESNQPCEEFERELREVKPPSARAQIAATQVL